MVPLSIRHLFAGGGKVLKSFTGLLSSSSWAALDGSLPIVALIGRPNVGKSALFNRLVKRKEALVFNTVSSHVTRDYKAGLASLGDLKFTVIDTSGFEPDMSLNTIQARATAHTAQLIQKLDIALFMLDSRQGLTPVDEEVAGWLRKHCTYVHVILVANKAEGTSGQRRPEIVSTMLESLKLGFGEPVGVSAETGEGMADLYSALQPHIDLFMKSRVSTQQSASEANSEGDTKTGHINGQEKAEDKQLKVAIMGLPNVGKSTLMNQLLGHDRCLIGPEPGLTRDCVRDGIHFDGWDVELMDTAGWIRRTRFSNFDECNGKVTLVSQLKSKEAMKFTHVVVLVVDAAQALGKDVVMLRRELSMAGEVLQEGRSLVVAFNKIDALSKPDQALVRQQGPKMVEKILHDMDGLPCICISAKTGEGCDMLLHTVVDLYKKWNKHVTTSNLNRWIRELDLITRLPGMASGGSDRVKFLAQTKVRPPTFSLFVSRKGSFRKSDTRTLIRSLRKSFDFGGIPVRMVITEKSRRSHKVKAT